MRRSGNASVVSIENGNGSMNAKNASAGHDQPSTDQPPTSSTTPNAVGNSDKASSGSMSDCTAMNRITTPIAISAAPVPAGFHVMSISIARRDHKTMSAK